MNAKKFAVENEASTLKVPLQICRLETCSLEHHSYSNAS